MTINFYLRDDHAGEKGEATIMVDINGLGERKRISVKRKVLPGNWDKSKQRVKSKDPDSQVKNAYLQKIVSVVSNLHVTRQHAGETVSEEELTQALEGVINPEKAAKKAGKTRAVGNDILLVDLIDKYIEYNSSLKAESYIKNYYLLKKLLENFSGAKLSEVNYDFFARATQSWLTDRQSTNNTINKNITLLKIVIKFSKKLGYTPPVVEDSVRIESIAPDKFPLTQQELLQLEITDFTKDKFSIAKDVFLFACYTGLRRSDICAIGPDNVKCIAGVYWLEFAIVKTRQKITIPIADKAMTIIEKYREHSAKTGLLLPIPPTSTLARNLKIICKAAGIDQVVEEVKYSGSKRLSKKGPKHDFISIHDARHTFATLFLEAGGRIEVLSKLLGHTKIETTMKSYVKISSDNLVMEIMKLYDVTKKP